MLIAKLINEFRMGFCKHEFEFFKEIKVKDSENEIPSEIMIFYRCKKCGFTQKIIIT